MPDDPWVRVAQIVVPGSDLAAFAATESPQTEWLPPPDSGYASLVSIFVAEPPAIESNEKSFAELVSRVDRSIDYINSLKAGEIDGSEGREIVRQVRGAPVKFTGQNYLLKYALPNFYFHMSMAYALLRKGGVELGKTDFIGGYD